MPDSKPGLGAAHLIDTTEKISFLGDPTRVTLLTQLSEPMSAAALARRAGLSRQAANYHLRALERGGYVEMVEERRKGNCTERILRRTADAYVLGPEALGELALTPEQVPDRASTAYLMAAAARSIREVGALERRAQAEGGRVATLTLDAALRFASASQRSAFVSELVAAFSALVAKYDAGDRGRDRAFRLTATLHPLPAEASKESPAST